MLRTSHVSPCLQPPSTHPICSVRNLARFLLRRGDMSEQSLSEPDGRLTVERRAGFTSHEGMQEIQNGKGNGPVILVRLRTIKPRRRTDAASSTINAHYRTDVPLSAINALHRTDANLSTVNLRRLSSAAPKSRVETQLYFRDIKEVKNISDTNVYSLTISMIDSDIGDSTLVFKDKATLEQWETRINKLMSDLGSTESPPS